MARPFRFLSVEDVLAIHADTVANEGGSAGLRDPGLLDAAVFMPRQQFEGQYLHTDLSAMASAYLFHIAANHPFIDGNKRAAVLAALVFLDVNGCAALPEPRELEGVTIAVASGAMTKDALTTWMRSKL